MRKKVTFEKHIVFPTMIGEISAISLEPNLRFVDTVNVEGDLLLKGKYKLTEASRLEEDFEYQIPIEISLHEKLDMDSTKIEISDFTYDLEDDNMICHIELLIEGEELVQEVLEEERECDDNPLEKEIEIPHIETEKEEISIDENREEDEDSHEVESPDNSPSSLFLNFNDDNETYGTFIVYMVRQNESINSILEKYHTTLEEVEQYNDITHIDIGSKIIIPLKNE